jgi:hypothetical protein
VYPSVESVSVPYQGTQLPGYLWKSAGGVQRHPALIVIGGIETFAEDCYFMSANPPMPDAFCAAHAQQGGSNKKDPVAILVFKQIAWRMGLKISPNPGEIARRFAKACDYLVHGKADLRKVSCPALPMPAKARRRSQFRSHASVWRNCPTQPRSW